MTPTQQLQIVCHPNYEIKMIKALKPFGMTSQSIAKAIIATRKQIIKEYLKEIVTNNAQKQIAFINNL